MRAPFFETQCIQDTSTVAETIYKKLEVHGRSRREAARRRNSEWTVNLGIRNSSPNNATCRMTPKTVPQNHVAYGIASAYSVRALWVCQ